MIDPVARSIPVEDARLATWVWGDGVPEVVFLHDGLGSVGQWRSVPGAVAEKSGRTVLAYDRPGHGDSTPVPTGPWPIDWMHHQARVLAGLLEAIEVDRPHLVGHSDGGTIALLYAAARPTAVSGVLALAAHSWVEPVCVDAIAAMAAAPDRYVAGLSRHHRHPAEVFGAWSGGWTSNAFRDWDVRDELGAVTAPALVVQGTDDEYATEAQAIDTAGAIGANAEHRLLAGAGHLLHHDDPDRVIDLIVEWLEAK